MTRAYRVLPWADVLYSVDNHWWEAGNGSDFVGERWSSHEDGEGHANDKTELAPRYGLRCVRGQNGREFSLDPSVIHYGGNSGFQAINLAIHFGCKHIILIGYDMRPARDGETRYQNFAPAFDAAAKLLPPDIRIVNATPGSHLRCFPIMNFDDALQDRRLYWDRAVAHA